MDRTRLESSITEMSAAEAVYEAALRRQAAVIRAARLGADADTGAQLDAANRELGEARTRVESARVNLDITRVNELATFETADQFLGFIPGSQVLALFPVGVEAKLEPGRLRVRVWPDAISTSTHDPRLTEQELAAAIRYWSADVAAAGEDASRAAWRALADELGATRAAWVARLLTPTNLDALAPGVAPAFPTVPMQDEAAPFVPRAGVLPDRWIAIGTRANVRLFEHVGAPIPIDLAVGLDTTPSEAAALANREGEPIQLPPRMRWMTDFAIAVQAGMAFDIPLPADVDHLDELLIVGVRVTQTPAQGAEALEALFTGHRFSRGLAFVAQDTPTNNSSAGGSGMPSSAARIEKAFEVERRPRAFATDLASNGIAAALAFGIAPEALAALPQSGAAAELEAEPEGFEPEIARAMQTVLWQVTVGSTLEDFLLIPSARAETVREYFREHVRAAGPIPALRVGRQPYGVLPVTTIDGFVARAEEGIDARLLPLLRAMRSWFAMKREGALFEGTAADALRHLARSMYLFAETTQQNASSTTPNRWEALAHALAVASRNTIRDTWRNSRITGTVEGAPRPVEQPVVDTSTATELASLATAAPAVILDGPQPASVLGRIARHAALLEWSRFARRAIEASVDIPSRRDLASRAAQSGSDLYIRVLTQAFLPIPPVLVRPTGPIGPVIGVRATRARRLDDDLPDLPEPGPLDPRDPDRPPPPPPPGEPEVTAAERQAIRTRVGSLTQPLASCPGAARLDSFRRALAQLGRFPATRLESELFRTLDICNHRLDAWFTSVAARRLATIRATAPRGSVIGGWGVLQDVRRANPADPRQRAEYIHTPSLDQAAAAAVLRSGARRAQGAGSSHADIDLSSRRVRLARWILEGIRNGRSLSDLLGARFERAVKGTPAEAQLGALRTRFPGFAGKGVLDGLRLQTERPGSSDPDVARSAAVVDEAMDAVADALMAEAVYQAVRGNPAGALVNLEALAGGAPPPQLRVTETPPSGIRLTHRIVVALPAGATAPGWTPNASQRAAAEPSLDAWCGLLLGPAAGYVLTVEHANGTTSSVPLPALGLGAIDVVLSGRRDGSELGERVVRAAAAGSESPPARVRTDRTWRDLAGLCDAAARVLTHGEPLRPDSFEPPSAMATATKEDFGDLPARVATAFAALTAVRDALAARADPAAAALQAAAFGIRVPAVVLGATPTTEQQDTLLAATETRLAAASTGTPRDRLRALFGGDLPGVVAFTLRQPETLVTTSTPPPASLLAGQALAPAAWLDAVSRTHRKTAALAEVVMRKDIVGDGGAAPLVVAQLPWRDGDRWIATSFASVAGSAPAGRLSVLVHAPAGFTAGTPIGGLLVDAWTETIPAPTRDTAMALRFNNASTRAPQVVLLAVSPDPVQAWSTTTLVEILQETLELARLRMRPQTDVSRAGLMPSVWLGQRPGNAGISFSL